MFVTGENSCRRYYSDSIPMMARTRSRKPGETKAADPDRVSNSAPSPHQIPAAELLSFLKYVHGVSPWRETELAKALKIGLPQAKEAIAALQLLLNFA